MRQKDVKAVSNFLTIALGFSIAFTCPLLLPFLALGAIYGGKKKRR